MKKTGSIIINFKDISNDDLFTIYHFLNDMVYNTPGLKYRTVDPS